jgi:hypothetical protein
MLEEVYSKEAKDKTRSDFAWHERFRASCTVDLRYRQPSTATNDENKVSSTANVFLNSELQTKTFASKSSVTSGMQWEGHGHETAGLFCTAPHLHIGRWWSKGLRKAQSDAFGPSAILLVLTTARLLIVSSNKK